VRSWSAPITIARHAYGDVYAGIEYSAATAAQGLLTVRLADGETVTLEGKNVDSPSVWRLMHNTERSIRAFAKSCFGYALSVRQDLWFSTKDTISKIYDGRFREIFEEEYENYRAEYEKCGITYFYTLIDDAVARVVRSRGGFVWALKNYDGDVMSDMVSSAFGSLAMMTSVLVSPDGQREFEAAHGTVTRHYQKYLAGEETSTNPMATIFAWSGALRRRGEIDELPELTAFADRLERASLETINAGIVTRDLAALMTEYGGDAGDSANNNADNAVRAVNTREFLDEIAARL
jgi:isocitrate dehydrogenase